MLWYNKLHTTEDTSGKKGIISNYSYSQLLNGNIIRKESLVPTWSAQYEGGDPVKLNLYTYTASYLEIIKLLTSGNSTGKYQSKIIDTSSLHEVILGNLPQRIYIDIDGVRDKDLTFDSKVSIDTFVTIDRPILEPIIKSMISTYNILYNEKIDVSSMLFFTSSNEHKISYHIVLNKVVSNFKEQKFFFNRVINLLSVMNANVSKYIDINVYKSVNCLRLPFSTKTDGTRIKQPFIFDHEGYTSDHHKNLDIAYYYICYGMISKVNGYRILPSLVVEEERIFSTIPLPQSHLDNVNIILLCNFKDDFEISKVEGNLICLKRIRPSHCPICDIIHEGENPFLTINLTEIKFYCRRADKKHITLGFIPDEVKPKIPKKKLCISHMITPRKPLLKPDAYF